MSKFESKQRVLIVGGGVAGLSCAWSLSRHPEKYEIDLWDPMERAGGVATSEEVIPGFTINDGVQGAPPSYHNLLKIHKMLGFEAFPIEMKISFGQGENAWCNYEPRKIQESLKHETRRFGKLLWWVYHLTPIFIAVPISTLLKYSGFSEAFGSVMVYPLVALFFGTGNQTPNVPAALIARVFLDPELRIFEYDQDRLLSQTPKFYAFRELRSIYQKFEDKISEAKTKTNFRWKTAVKRVRRPNNGKIYASDDSGAEKEFDAVVFACSAENVLKILDKPTWLERKVLGNVRYFDDVTYTHTDVEYMQNHYHLGENGEQYFIHNYEKDPTRIEMSFDLSCYQPMLAEKKLNKGFVGPAGDHQRDDSKHVPRIFQTIFLDAKECGHLWTREKLDQSKVLLVKWWKQFAHTWTHFLFTVPLLRFIQGGTSSSHNNVLYAGAYTLFNTHELAAVSGLAAAERLGAEYPFHDDLVCSKTMNMYSFVAHGRVRGTGPTGSSRSYLQIILEMVWGGFMRLAAVGLLLLQRFIS